MSPAGRHDCGALVISTEKEKSHQQNYRDLIVLSLSIFRGKSIKKTFLINCLGDSIQGAFDNEMSPAGRHDCGALVISTERRNHTHKITEI